MFRNRMPRYEVLSEDAMATLDKGWRRLMTEIGVEFMDDRALDLFRQAGQRVEDKTVFLDPDFVLEQVAKAPREFDLQARNPANSRAHRRRLDGLRRGLRAAVRARGRRTPRRHHGRLPQLRPARPELRGARLRRWRGQRAQRHPARQPAPRHGLRAADADRQDLHGQRRLGRQRRRHDRDDRDPVRLPRGDRGDAGDHLADQLQLAAALGRPDARVAVRVLRGQPARRADAVHPDGRDVAGDDPGRAGAADRRGAVGDRALPADPARAAPSSSARSSPTSTCSPGRRRSARRSRASACCAPARSRGTSGCRSAPAAGSRPRRCPTRRPATRR